MDLFSVSGKVVVITGGSMGLGRAMAVGFGKSGARVVVASRTKRLIEETAHEIIKNGGSASAVQVDVKNSEDIEKMLTAAADLYGGVDILVNNAGIAPMNKTIDTTEEEWDNVIDTNLKSVFLASKLAARRMIRQRHGKIINIASVLGKMATNVAVHYCSSKAGVIQMTRAQALEWARFNINVNCIAPGYFETNMTKEQQSNDSHMSFLLSKIPYKRLGKPEEIVGTAIFLASGAASYITGATIFVDGGYSIW